MLEFFCGNAMQATPNITYNCSFTCNTPEFLQYFQCICAENATYQISVNILMLPLDSVTPISYRRFAISVIDNHMLVFLTIFLCACAEMATGTQLCTETNKS